ncbi:DUF6470 family protein [Carboxydothermus pertinax]|uniref:Uncharacterized protein n=1 Tax=Carboxydothermus pertinax TaxID=870242 RepID=A0A1L8CUF2_9THEO|nr:DUF6470 family protein [Carboxydothermus pertinax]GAV22538.1 hypothetical protein cpu_10480 [Carboxydothermus pertinax]
MTILKVQVDSTRCRADLGYLIPSEFSRAYARQGREEALEGTGRRAEEGDYLAAFEKGNTIENLVIPPVNEVELTVRMLPSVRPVIKFHRSNSVFLDVYI